MLNRLSGRIDIQTNTFPYLANDLSFTSSPKSLNSKNPLASLSRVVRCSHLLPDPTQEAPDPFRELLHPVWDPQTQCRNVQNNRRKPQAPALSLWELLTPHPPLGAWVAADPSRGTRPFFAHTRADAPGPGPRAPGPGGDKHLQRWRTALACPDVRLASARHVLRVRQHRCSTISGSKTCRRCEAGPIGKYSRRTG